MQDIRNTFKSSVFTLRLILVSLLLMQCNSTQKVDEDVLAQINDLTVTEDHFLAAFKKYYYKVGQSLAPSKENKLSVLNTEFTPYILTIYAREKGLADDRISDLEYGLLTRKIYVEEYLEHEVLDKILITESDTRELYLRFNTTLRASHLFASNEEEANKLYQKLKDGESFEKLAAETFENPYLAQNGGDIGEFRVDEMDIAFENTAFNMNLGEISKPVKTRQGYSVIKLTDRFTNPVITEFQYSSQKNNLAVFVQKRKEELAIRSHIKNTIASLNIDEKIVRTIWEDIVNKGSVLEHDYEGQELAISTDLADNKLISSKGNFSFTVEDLKKEGYYSAIQNLNRINDLEDFENFIKGLIYRTYIIYEFKNTAHIKDKSIESSIDQSFYVYLSNRATDYIRNSIELTEAELFEEFESARDMYDFPLMVNVARIVVSTKEQGEAVVSEIKNGLNWNAAVVKHTIRNEDRLVYGEMGLKSIQSYGTHAFHIKDMEIGEVFGPLEYQTGELFIYKVLGKKEPREASFYEVKDLVRKILTEKKLEQHKFEVITEVMERNDAVIYKEKLNKIEINL